MKPRIAPPSHAFPLVQQTVRSLGLTTVCQESRCPNQAECWSGGTATFMVMGDTCTRGCKFCHVTTAPNGQPLDPDEPRKLAQAVEEWDLDYVVVTSVDRDDLPDQGAGHFAACIRALKSRGVLVEVLIPDFRGNQEHLQQVIDAGPDVIAHNLETVPRLTPGIRDPRATYHQSLQLLAAIKQRSPGIITKTSLILGFGEQDQEVLQTMHDLRAARVDILTLGQYLRPSPRHYPVKEYLPQEKWEFFQMMGEDLGFAFVASGPLVRSSYRAGELFVKHLKEAR